MKLLGHADPEMTMRYVDVTSNDLQREYHLAREKPRHIIPHPKAPTTSPRTGLDGVIDSLLFAQHAIEMFRRSLPDGPERWREWCWRYGSGNRKRRVADETARTDSGDSRLQRSGGGETA